VSVSNEDHVDDSEAGQTSTAAVVLLGAGVGVLMVGAGMFFVCRRRGWRLRTQPMKYAEADVEDFVTDDVGSNNDGNDRTPTWKAKRMRGENEVDVFGEDDGEIGVGFGGDVHFVIDDDDDWEGAEGTTVVTDGRGPFGGGATFR